MPLRLHQGRITRLRCYPTSVSKDAFQREVTEEELEQSAGSSLSALMGSAKQTDDTPSEAPVMFVELEVGSRHFHGLLAACPAQVNDEVRMAVDGHVLLGMALPQQRLIALRPGCFRGRQAQIKASLRLWGWLCLWGCLLIGSLAYGLNRLPGAAALWASGGSAAFALLTGLMVQRHYHGNLRWSCRLTEEVLTTLGLDNPTDIDLRELSKTKSSRSADPEYGTHFFSY